PKPAVPEVDGGNPGNILLVVAPSGAGKSTLVNALLARDSGVGLSISYTTRPPRSGEQDAREYHFVTDEEFMRRRAAGEFLESAEVHGNYYATSRTWIEERLHAGSDVLLEIDWQGAPHITVPVPPAGVNGCAQSAPTQTRPGQLERDHAPPTGRRQRNGARPRVRLRDHQRGS